MENHNEEHMLTVIDEDGREIECEILFTFDSEEYEKDYVIYMPIGDEFIDEDGIAQVNAASYVTNEAGEVTAIELIEDEDEWDMIEEMIASFVAEHEDDDPVS